MSAPNQSVCTAWAGTEDLCSPCLENLESYDPALVGDALLIASDVLYQLTRQRWPGWCEDTVRPISSYVSPDTRRSVVYGRDGSYGISRAETFGLRAELVAGFLGGALVCNCRDVNQVGCTWFSQIELGEVPITGIVEVLIDGNVIDPDRYRVDDYRWLVYMRDPTGADDRAGWPCCQRIDLPSTEVGTFEVTYTVGTAPPRGGVRAAAALACQFILAWTPGADCKLPTRVTSLTRQQVSMALSDPLALFADGLTGLPEVDLWVQSVLRGDRTRQAAVVVPERLQRKARRAGT